MTVQVLFRIEIVIFKTDLCYLEKIQSDIVNIRILGENIFEFKRVSQIINHALLDLIKLRFSGSELLDSKESNCKKKL